MSQENVEIVGRAWEAWNRGDVDAMLEAYDPECVFDLTHYPAWPDVGGAVRGRDAIREFFSGFLAAWESWAADLESLVDVGDDRVFNIVRQPFKGRESGIRVEMHWAQIYTLRDGKITLIENYSDRAEALAAVGLSE